jgi:hypothetical protein
LLLVLARSDKRWDEVRVRVSSRELALELRLLVSGVFAVPEDRFVWDSFDRLLAKGAELCRSPSSGRF